MGLVLLPCTLRPNVDHPCHPGLHPIVNMVPRRAPELEHDKIEQYTATQPMEENDPIEQFTELSQSSDAL